MCLGSSDLNLIKDKALVIQAQNYLDLIRWHWPEVIIIWSANIPQKDWRNAMHPGAMHKAQKNDNSEIRAVLEGG